VAREKAAMGPIRCATTRKRSVLGTMNEFALHVGLMREAEPAMTEHAMSMKLGRVLVTVPTLGYQQPAELTAQTLQDPKESPRRPGATTRREPPMNSSARIYELRITLRDTRPPIWRRLRVQSDATLFEFHSILQLVMGWMDDHLHQFMAKNKVYGAVDLELPERENEKKVLLSQVLRKPKDSLVYEYDFGDGWEHAVVLEQVLEAVPGGKYPYVVTGKRACPPEDCGGTGGYGHLLAVLADPKHPEHAEMVEWVAARSIQRHSMWARSTAGSTAAGPRRRRPTPRAARRRGHARRGSTWGRRAAGADGRRCKLEGPYGLGLHGVVDGPCRAILVGFTEVA
jgi:hypothetical protein